MPEKNNLDGLLREAQKSKSAEDAQPETTKTTITGPARLPCATHTEQTKTTSELGLAELNHKVDQLTSPLSNVTPVVQKLKAAYDAA